MRKRTRAFSALKSDLPRSRDFRRCGGRAVAIDFECGAERKRVSSMVMPVKVRRQPASSQWKQSLALAMAHPENPREWRTVMGCSK